MKLEELLEAFASNDFQLYSLQKEVTQEEKDLLTKNNIINLSSELTDFKKTAQFIEELDFIVGCDTAVTNLSLALGKETCVLLPFFADYRWGLLEFWTPWYSSAKLFRQENPDIWTEPIQNLKNYLLKK